MLVEQKDNMYPHRRYNPLSGDYILVSPHRTKRPWQGSQELPSKELRPSYDSECYLCPGNERAGEKINPKYDSTFVFTNDFSALLPNVDSEIVNDNNHDSLFHVESVKGECRVICFSPHHNLTLAQMDVTSIRNVIDVWNDQMTELGEKYKWVQVFENKGEIMGSSNPHPHGQIWASNYLPNELNKENLRQKEYYEKNGISLLVQYLDEELAIRERIVVENEHWVALVPFWAVWPYETMLLPKRHVKQIAALTEKEKDSLSEILKIHLTKYDNLFNTSFPYTMGWHGAPFDDKNNSYWQLHAHFYPPLLRSASIKKFMVGFEMLAESQRDITAEQAADKLKSLSEIHYKNNE